MSRPVLPESAYEALGLDPETVKIFVTPIPQPATVVAPNLLHSNEDLNTPMAPNETSITLYAELLLHIRTVTLFASLRTNCSRETKARLSADGTKVTVSHEGYSATIRLPINVKGGGDAALSLPSQPAGKEATLRLQIEEQEGTDLLDVLQGDERQFNVTPWDGVTLHHTGGIDICCKACGAIVVPKANVTIWQDLPNENWAEMMDFWHCHKPDEHHLHDRTHNEIVSQKGYAAGNKLQAVAGVGFVDLTSFLFKNSDCKGTEVLSEYEYTRGPIVCRMCGKILGSQDPLTDGWRIWKWSIQITPPPQSSIQPLYSTQKWISTRFLHLIENLGLRKFHIHPPLPVANISMDTGMSSPSPSPSPPAYIPSLLVWVFTPDLFFSSSMPSPDRLDPTRAIKIFYQKQTWKPLEPGEAESTTVEDVEFPRELLDDLREALDDSQKLIPFTARTFQEWQVGLLERFDIRDVWRGGDGNGEEQVDGQT